MNQDEYRIADHLPESLNRDNMYELAELVDEKIAELNQMSELVSIYPRIDELSSNLIDALAIQFHVDYYSTALPLDARRALVKNSLRWHVRKGTRAAVEEAAQSLYGDAEIVEWYEYNDAPYYFRVDMHGKLMPSKDIADVVKIVNAFKNARSWLRGVIWWPKNLFRINQVGSLVVQEIPERLSIEKKPYVVFDYGMNASCEVQTEHKIIATSTQHIDSTFSHGTLSGRLMLNKSGDYSIESRDLGQNVAEVWLAFTGSRTNGKGMARLNDAPTAYRKKVYYKANWQNVIDRHGNALNSGGVKQNKWVSEEKTELIRKIFKHPLYALNQAGNVTKELRDYGYDTTIIETIFTGNRLNSGAVSKREDVTEYVAQNRYTVFTASCTNGRGMITTNQAESKKISTSDIIHKARISSIFGGAILNGNAMTNTIQSIERQLVVHIPNWRTVHKRSGATILNAAKHEIRHQEIKHITPSRKEKKFNPAAGALLNDRAAIGYMQLS